MAFRKQIFECCSPFQNQLADDAAPPHQNKASQMLAGKKNERWAWLLDDEFLRIHELIVH